MKITKEINKEIFRAYDIRGIADRDLTDDVIYTIARSFATHIRRMGKDTCVIGHDNRLSSERIHKALTKGLLDSGVNILDLELTTTPMYYYACIYEKIDCGVMITASHNPKEDNGLKFAFQDYLNAKGEEIAEFYEETIKGDFLDGAGSIHKINVKEEYFNAIKNGLNFGDKRIKAILDPGNGTTSIILKDLYSMFPIDFTIINGESDGTFPNHHPDPSIEANLEQLKAKVLETGADIGVSFDGDGDRVGVITNKGKFLPIDYYMILIIRDIIDKVSNKTFLYDVKCSKSLEDEIIKLGGTPVCYRTGNSYTRSRVAELDMPFGGELSGHVYFRDRFLGFDSGLYAGLRIIELLSRNDKTIEELLTGINHYEATPELKYKSTDEKKREVVEKVIEYCREKHYNINTIDGVRVTFDDGWASVRFSNTGPNITSRFEAASKKRLEEIQKEFESLIDKYNK